MKITTTRLGELVKQGNVAKTEEGNHKIATLAIIQLTTKRNTACKD